MKEKVQKAIEELKPHLQADGGDIELVDVTEDGVVKVRLLGACVGCPMRQMTLKGMLRMGNRAQKVTPPVINPNPSPCP